MILPGSIDGVTGIHSPLSQNQAPIPSSFKEWAVKSPGSLLKSPAHLANDLGWLDCYVLGRSPFI